LDFYILDIDGEKILGSNIDQPTRIDFTKKSPWELIQEHPLSIADQNWRIIFTKDLSLVAPKFANWLIICLSMLLGCAMVVGVLVITGNIEELKTLLRALSHDLTNPLTVIMGYARKGKLDMENAGQVAPALYFSKILNSAENQRDVIEHFKMMRANADGKHTLRLEKVSIASVISQIEHTFEQRLRDKQLTLKVPRSENAKLQIIAEPISLNHNVFNNLISNAIKFSHIGGAIEISVQESTNLVQVVVRDHGVGMPKDLANKVFRSDLSTSRVGTGGETGTGFGMPVAKAYMTRYGGSIHITSRTETESPGDHGTTVLLTFKSGSF
jgi:signal transduction histidine kinase